MSNDPTLLDPPDADLVAAAFDHAGPGASRDVFEVVGTARAMRYLRPDPVPTPMVDALVWAATRAPNPNNTQPWHFVVVTDRDTLGQIGAGLAPVMGARGEQAAARQPDMSAEEQATRRGGVHLGRSLGEVPVLVLVCAERSYPAHAPEERYVWSTVYPAAQNIIVAARALGLGATFTTFHHFADQAFRGPLGIPEEVYIGAVIPIGWPDRRFGPVRRRPIAEVIHRDRW